MTTNLLDKMTVQEQIYALDNEVSAQDDKITSATETANSAMTRADGAQDTANSAMTRADSAQATANSAQTRADSAQADANTAKATADTAQSSAETAQSTADTAQSKVNGIINGETWVPYANIAKMDEGANVITDTYATKTALKAISDITDAIAPLDTTPTEGSTKGVTSGGVYQAIQAGGGGGLTIDVITDQFTFATGIEKYAGEILKINNKLVIFQLEVKNTSSSSISSIGMMPSGTYPAETAVISVSNSSSSYASYAFITASGAVNSNRQSVPANGYGWFFGTYLIAGGA